MFTFPSVPELLSDDSLAVSSPRLSPDQCRIVYLRYPSLVPHHQCSQLCMVSCGLGRGVGRQEEEQGSTEGSPLSPPGPSVKLLAWLAVMV